MRLVTLDRLNRALYDVIRDFEHLGIWNDRMYSVDIVLVPLHYAYGLKWDGEDGHIDIPAVSLSRLGSTMFGIGQKWGLRDVLRHEYAHATADLYPELSRTSSFRWTFGRYDHGKRLRAYDPEHNVTPYAATRPCEDFAEVFMYYIKTRGKLPNRFDTRIIRSKWDFVSRYVKSIARKG